MTALLYLWDQNMADKRLVVKLTDSALLELGVLIPVEPTDRICTYHTTFTNTLNDYCYADMRHECIMVDVVRVTP